MAAEPSSSSAEPELRPLFQFGEVETPWVAMDDSVMGGVSASNLRSKDGIGLFAGTLSLENNGGFASVRSGAIESGVSGTRAMRLRVKGDGKRYQMRIYAEGGRSGISYRASFDTTADEWIEVTLPYDEFNAGWRGRIMPEHPAIDPEQIFRIGLLIADKQVGTFAMEVDWIAAVPE